MELLEIFKTLAKIPSPSLKEDDVAGKIVEMLSEAKIDVRRDDFGNVYAKIPGNSDKPSLLLSAHMDVVGDDSPVNIVENGDFIETDKTRTLGADDKAGVSAIVKLLLDIKKAKSTISSDIDNPGTVEAVFTKDEENSMSGIEHVEFNKLGSKYVLVLDSDKLGNFEISGAGFIKLTVSVKTPFGGHSGLDIADTSRLNAAKLLAELVSKIPQGVWKKDENGIVTSINLGAIIGGGVENAMADAVLKNLKGADAVEYTAKHAMTNIINTHAFAQYSVRSSNIESQEELVREIRSIIDEFNLRYGEIDENGLKYPALAFAKLESEVHLPVFEKSGDDFLIKKAEIAAKNSGVNLKISSFHAGAETHIYANRKNASGEVFEPVLLGIADVFNMHSSDEKIDTASYKKGYEFLKEFLKAL